MDTDDEEAAAPSPPNTEWVSLEGLEGLEGRGGAAGGGGRGAGDGRPGQAWPDSTEIWGGGGGGGEPEAEGEDAAQPEPEAGPEPEPEEEEEETYEYTEQQVVEMRAAFAAFDLFRNDSIPIGRLGAVLRSLRLNPTERQLHDAARWLDADPARGVVRFKEFLIITGRALRDPVTEDRVLEGFLRLDEDATGVVDRARLADVLTTTGEKLYPNEFAAFIKYADPKRRGVVKYEDFVKRMGSGQIKGKKKKKKRKKGKKRRKIKQRDPGGMPTSSANDLISY